MNGTDTFYCVKCNRLEEPVQASILFRTGYYRVIHPLGCCVACESAESAMAGLLAELRGEAGMVQPYFGTDMHGGFAAAGGGSQGRGY